MDGWMDGRLSRWLRLLRAPNGANNDTVFYYNFCCTQYISFFTEMHLKFCWNPEFRSVMTSGPLVIMPKQGRKEEWGWSGESRAQQIRLEWSGKILRANRYCLHVPPVTFLIFTKGDQVDFWTKKFPSPNSKDSCCDYLTCLLFTIL